MNNNKKQNRLIKICGVQDSVTAYFAAEKGADFVGLIFDAESKRFVSYEAAQQIAHAAKQGGATPVAVFTNQNGKEMLDICAFAGITTVQLHGEIAKREHINLPDIFTRIYVLEVDPNGHIIESNGHIEALRETRDYLLYDGLHPGSGEPFAWRNFQPQDEFPFFLAGGLNLENIEKALSQINPDGIDVSSGVENALGKKDQKKIASLIEKVLHE